MFEAQLKEHVMARTTNVDPVTQKLALLLEEAKAELAAWTAEVERVQGQLVARMKPGPQGKFAVEDGTDVVTATMVVGEGVSLDEGRLKRKVGSATWNRITTQVLDKKKLEAAILTDLIPAEVVAECSEVKPRKPYVLVTRKPRIRGANRRAR